MRYLLDTCAWLGALLAPEKLSSEARDIFSAPEMLSLSSISLIEFAQKEANPKGGANDIVLSMDPDLFLTKIALPPQKIKILPITPTIAVESYHLPEGLIHNGKPHKDPADLIITSTARIHGLTVITSDQILLRYGHLSTLPSRA